MSDGMSKCSLLYILNTFCKTSVVILQKQVIILTLAMYDKLYLLLVDDKQQFFSCNKLVNNPNTFENI